MHQRYPYLEGSIDTHVHSAPDVRERKLTDYQLLKAGVSCKTRGVVIKSHHLPTVARAAVMNEVCRDIYGSAADFQMFGGITLNRYVGGINPWAVETALEMKGKVVWLPTFDSEHEAVKKGHSHGVICTKNGGVTDELKTVLTLIRDFNVALATSHLSPYDIFIVVEEAKKTGINKIIISHPESNLVGLTWEEQKRLVNEYDVMLERCYAQPIGGGKYQSNLEDNYQAVKEIGSSNIILATDAGQVQNPFWYDSFHESIMYLADRGIPSEAIKDLINRNPRKVLGIEQA